MGQNSDQPGEPSISAEKAIALTAALTRVGSNLGKTYTGYERLKGFEDEEGNEKVAAGFRRCSGHRYSAYQAPSDDFDIHECLAKRLSREMRLLAGADAPNARPKSDYPSGRKFSKATTMQSGQVMLDIAPGCAFGQQVVSRMQNGYLFHF